MSEFCKHCGAGIGDRRREGEGTCLKCEQWAFQEGIIWASAFIAGVHDRPTIAADMCIAAGIDIKRLRASEEYRVNETQRKAVNKICAELR